MKDFFCFMNGCEFRYILLMERITIFRSNIQSDDSHTKENIIDRFSKYFSIFPHTLKFFRR